MNIKTGIYLLSFLVVSLLTPAADAASAKIITKENAIREDCRFFSTVIVKVKYADMVKIVSKDGDWYKVKYNDLQGCIHKSAVEEKKFRMSRLIAPQSGAASADEVALAGKGFNPQVEESYRNKHPEADFNAVDKIESYGVQETSLKEFIESGGLNQP